LSCVENNVIDCVGRSSGLPKKILRGALYSHMRETQCLSCFRCLQAIRVLLTAYFIINIQAS